MSNDTAQTKSFDFTVKDDHGEEHRYVGALFQWEEGMNLAAELTSVVAPGIAMMEGPASGGRGITTVMNNAIRAGGASLVRRVLAECSRDGESLDDPTAMRRAFTGNYGEALRACSKVIEENYGPLLEPLVNRCQEFVTSLSGNSPGPLGYARGSEESGSSGASSTQD